MYVCVNMYALKRETAITVCMYVCEVLHHGVVLSVPVYSGLGHEHGYVLLQLVVVELQRLLDQVVLAGQTSILQLCMYVCMYLYVHV